MRRKQQLALLKGFPMYRRLPSHFERSQSGPMHRRAKTERRLLSSGSVEHIQDAARHLKEG